MSGVLVHLLLLIVSFAFIFQAQNLAEAAHNLMHALCHNSETPETYMRCLAQAPNAEKANNVGIATIFVNCINDQAQSLATNFTRLAFETSDNNLKSLYQSCGKRYSSTKNQYLQVHKYDNAESSMARALKSAQDCNQQMKIYDSMVPYYIFFYTRIYEELAEGAFRIIEKLY